MSWISPLGLAYRRWSYFQPFDNGNCCSSSHYRDDRPMLDEHVCERERAWRDYVRLRDHNPAYGTPNMEIVVVKNEGSEFSPDSEPPGSNHTILEGTK